ALRPIYRPAVGDSTIEQAYRGWQQPVRWTGQRRLQMQEQSRPLQSVSDSRAVRLKLIIWPIAVVLQLWMPVRIEGLWNPPCLGLGELQCHPPCDLQSPAAPSMITSDIGCGQQRFDRVHVGINP